MRKYKLEPLSGIGPIKLGMTRKEVRSDMQEKYKSFKKTPDDPNLTDAFFNSTFQIFYDKNDNVEYIELSGYKSFEFVVVFNEIKIFETKADDLIEKISQKASYDKTNDKIPYSYIFPTLELSLWRPNIPDVVDNKNSNEYHDSLYFQTVGIGIKGYYTEEE